MNNSTYQVSGILLICVIIVFMVHTKRATAVSKITDGELSLPTEADRGYVLKQLTNGNDEPARKFWSQTREYWLQKVQAPINREIFIEGYKKEHNGEPPQESMIQGVASILRNNAIKEMAKASYQLGLWAGIRLDYVTELVFYQEAAKLDPYESIYREAVERMIKKNVPVSKPEEQAY